MKYGESTFDIIYLLFAIILGILMIRKSEKGTTSRLMGIAVLILGCGDAFHLFPRVLNYFVDSDFTAALGFGKLVTSITMTVFYIFVFWIWQNLYGMKEKTARTAKIIYILAAIRVILCLFPQNHWFSNEGSVLWGILRNLPFVLIGLIIIYAGTMSVFALLNMKGYFDAIPTEIEEAGRIDGCSDRMLVTKIVMPLSKPTLIVTGVMIVNFVWNEYIFSVNFLTGSDRMTLAAGLYSLQATETSGSWPVFAAASILVSIPVLIIFFVSQKNMVSGLTSGGVKG